MFFIRKGGCGRKSVVEENSGGMKGRLELDFGTLTRVIDCLGLILKTINPFGFWRRKLDSAIIFFQVLSNACC